METLNRLDRPNKSPVKLAEPPTDLRSGSWEALQYWSERSQDGHITNVVCDACGSVYWGKWGALEVKDGLKRVAPNLDSGLIWDRMGRVFACTCQAGRKWAHVFPVASGGLVESTMKAGDKLADVGGQMLKELGGLSRALEKLTESFHGKRVAAIIQEMGPEARAIQIRLKDIMERPNVVAAMKYLEARERSLVARLWMAHQTHLDAALIGDPEAAEKNLTREVMALLETARELWRRENVQEPVEGDGQKDQKYTPATRDQILGVTPKTTGEGEAVQGSGPQRTQGTENPDRTPPETTGGNQAVDRETEGAGTGDELATSPKTGDGVPPVEVGGQVPE